MRSSRLPNCRPHRKFSAICYRSPPRRGSQHFDRLPPTFVSYGRAGSTGSARSRIRAPTANFFDPNCHYSPSPVPESAPNSEILQVFLTVSLKVFQALLREDLKAVQADLRASFLGAASIIPHAPISASFRVVRVVTSAVSRVVTAVCTQVTSTLPFSVARLAFLPCLLGRTLLFDDAEEDDEDVLEDEEEEEEEDDTSLFSAKAVMVISIIAAARAAANFCEFIIKREEEI